MKKISGIYKKKINKFVNQSKFLNFSLIFGPSYSLTPSHILRVHIPQDLRDKNGRLVDK